MATHTITADSTGIYDDSYYFSNSNGSDQTANRNDTSSTSTSATSTTYNFVTVGAVLGNKPVFRSGVAFDIKTAVTGGDIPEGSTVDSIALKVYLYANVTGFLKITNFGNTHGGKYDFSASVMTSTAAFPAIIGRPSSGTYAGNVTEYFTAFSNSEGNKTIALNSTAISDAQTIVDAGASASPGELGIMFINSSDFTDSSYPTYSGIVDYHGAIIATAEHATSSSRPAIEVTYTEGGVTHNAVIFGTNF